LNRRYRILIVEDDPDIRWLLREGLEAEGFDISEADSIPSFMRQLETVSADLITLDLGLPNGDSLAFLQKVRSKRNIPVIILTGRSAPEERVTGLENGADDYIIKPFLLREVVMRIRAVLDRYGAAISRSDPYCQDSTGERFHFEAGILDTCKRAVTSSAGRDLNLTSTEFELLAILLRNQGRILSRDELSMMLNGRAWVPSDRTLDGHIARVRRKIEPTGGRPQLIKSVRNVGYVYTGHVRKL
jgi:two-component system, OmpR family, response regulator